MIERIPVTDADIVREHRLRHLPGSPVDSLTNPAMRICLVTLAELRKRREQRPTLTVDGKRLAAGDTE